MHRFSTAALAGFMAFAAALPAGAQTPAPATPDTATAETVAPQTVTAETVVATVNGTDITLGHMLVLRARLPREYQALPAEALFDGILEQLIQQEILHGQSEGLSRTGRLILDNEERTLHAVQMAEEIARERVTEEAIQAAYDAEFANVDPGAEFNAAHILVATEEEAQAVVTELEGGADFAELASVRSLDTGSGQAGGDLGWFGAGMMVEPFEAAVMALEPGQTSAPIETQFGWHVIRLNESRPLAAPTLEEVREEIAGRLEQEVVEAAIAEFTESADISRAEPGSIDPAVIGNMGLLEE